VVTSFDNVRHDRLLAKVAQRIDDADIMHLLKVMLKASGKKGVPQGGVISPVLSNLYLNEVDKMLERAREVTRNGRYTYIEYARFADDLVILPTSDMTGWSGLWKSGFGRSSTSCRLKSMMKRAAQWTLSAVSASGSWALSSATSAV
jgi:hypothetical protein